MRNSSVKINIMLNRAGLLLIIIYINNVRRRMLQQQHHFGEMIAYHASPARLVKTLTKPHFLTPIVVWRNRTAALTFFSCAALFFGMLAMDLI